MSAEIANACNNIPTVSEEKTKQLKRSISDIEKQLDVLIEMRINGEISGEIIKKKSTPLEEMLESNRKELLRIQEQKRTTISFDDTKKYLTDMLQKMNTANEEGLKEIFNAFVENITINKDDVATILGHFKKLIGKARIDRLPIQIDDMIVGVLYGEKLSNNYKMIASHYPVYCGAEFWKHLTGDDHFYYRLAKAFGEVVEEDNIDGSALILQKINELSEEISKKGGL